MAWDLEFDEPIAERVIDGTNGELTVKLGPLRMNGKMWYCPYQIDGLPGEQSHRMFGGGIDGIHAIILALANLGAYLDSRKDELGLNFEDQDFLGFLSIKQPPLSNWVEDE